MRQLIARTRPCAALAFVVVVCVLVSGRLSRLHRLKLRGQRHNMRRLRIDRLLRPNQ